jgi:hypothetical protein
MRHGLRSVTAAAAAAASLLAGGVPTASAAVHPPGASGRAPSVLHVGQIDRQDVPSRNGCEPDTLVEPDVAVSPFNPSIQVAVAHDCRFASGGALDISYAWTHDGGRHWHHAPLPKLTKVVGGAWARASDPVVAFGADGSVFVSALVLGTGCTTGLTVSRSVNGGATFAPPVVVQKSTRCSYSDDKDWLTIDTQPDSPFYGRIYEFWTAFLASGGKAAGSPQVVRWSGDSGRHWSTTHVVSAPHANSQNSQPMIQPDGLITDVYLDSGNRSIGDGPRSGGPGERGGAPQAAAAGSGVSLLSRISFDGGRTWHNRSLVARNIGGGPAGIRCCLPASTADPVTGKLYTVWEGNGPGSADPVLLSSSANGVSWSPPRQVTPAGPATVQHVNVAVAAYGGRAFVSYGTRNTAVDKGRFVQQQVSSSYDAGASFGPPLSVGPRSNLAYAAVAGGEFPGDYVGASATAARLNIAWCVSSKPRNPDAAYHQTLYSAVLRP